MRARTPVIPALCLLLAACAAGPTLCPAGREWTPGVAPEDAWRRTADGLATISLTPAPGAEEPAVHLQVLFTTDRDVSEVRVRPVGAEAPGRGPIGEFRRGLGWHLHPDPEPRPLLADEPVLVERGHWANLTLRPLLREFDLVLRAGEREVVVPVRLRDPRAPEDAR